MKCIYYSCFVILFNAFFCFGDPTGERRPEALAKTPKIKEFVPWHQPVNFAHPRDHLSVVSRRVRSAQKPNAEFFKQRIVASVTDGITALYLFPNNYEYDAVYDCLMENGASDQKKERCLKVLSDKLHSECKIEETAWTLIKFKGKEFFMAICGEASICLPEFIINCSHLFKNLKTIFLGGTCGCSDDTLPIGSILISETYYWMKKTVIGSHLDRQEDCTDENDIVQCKGFYFNKKRGVQETQFPNASGLINKLSAHGIPVHVGINFSSDSFINDRDARDIICEAFGGNIIAFNMEDGCLASQCKDKSWNFYAFRVISDHAGATTREQIEPNREEACRRLGEFFVTFMGDIIGR